MTLNDIMPTFRASIPDPLNADVWPAHTVVSLTDLVVSGVSMCRLVEYCATPCVHNGDASVPGTHGRRESALGAAVVIVTVTDVLSFDAERVVLVDGCLDDVDAIWKDARLIGRVSVARTSPAPILCGASTGAVRSRVTTANMPLDVCAGDLLAIPCRGEIAARDVRCHTDREDQR